MKLVWLVKILLRQLLLVDSIRSYLAWLRFFYFVKIKNQLKTYEDEKTEIAENTIWHNLKNLSDLAVSRSLKLIRPLSVIEVLNPESKILSIGPRTEGELLNLVAHGFAWNNIRGLDLISYSPRVDLGDMHQMPYEDNTWDAICMGWVLAYSDDPVQACKEVIRVAKPGAIVAIGVEYNPLTNEQILEQYGYLAGSAKRISSVSQILSFFCEGVDRVYFSHDVTPERHDEVGSLCAIFSIKK